MWVSDNVSIQSNGITQCDTLLVIYLDFKVTRIILILKNINHTLFQNLTLQFLNIRQVMPLLFIIEIFNLFFLRADPKKERIIFMLKANIY